MPEIDDSYGARQRQIRAAEEWLQRFHDHKQPYIYAEECGRASTIIASLLDELERER